VKTTAIIVIGISSQITIWQWNKFGWYWESLGLMNQKFHFLWFWFR